jgi:hypothetical protein
MLLSAKREIVFAVNFPRFTFYSSTTRLRSWKYSRVNAPLRPPPTDHTSRCASALFFMYASFGRVLDDGWKGARLPVVLTMAPRLTIIVLCALCSLYVTHAGPSNYTEALLTESQNRQGHCCRTLLDLRSRFPTLSHAVTATILSRFTFVARNSQSFGTLPRCECTDAAETSLLVRFGFWKLPFRYTDAAYQEQECAQVIQDPVVLIPVIRPANHFGHQMSTIVTALAAIKLYLGGHGLDITKIPVMLTYQDGPRATVNPNIRGVLVALGFNNTITLDTSLGEHYCVLFSHGWQLRDETSKSQVLKTSRYAFAKHCSSAMGGTGSITKTKMVSGTTAFTAGRESCRTQTLSCCTSLRLCGNGSVWKRLCRTHAQEHKR